MIGRDVNQALFPNETIVQPRLRCFRVHGLEQYTCVGSLGTSRNESSGLKTILRYDSVAQQGSGVD